MLESIIRNKSLAWDNNLKWENQVTEFNKSSLNELDDLVLGRDSNLNSVKKEISTLKSSLDFGPGFLVVKGLARYLPDERRLEKVLLHISEILGKPIPQNKQGELVKRVYDRGTKIEQKGRYSESRYGGDMHTDGAEIPYPVPKYLPLLGVRKAKEGGMFQIISVYTMHNILIKDNPELLKRLYKNFYWDRRGDLGPKGEETFEKPIFSYKNNELCCSYLRTYINEGYKKTNVQLKEIDKLALDSVDGLLNNKGLIVTGYLEPGQLLISNNFYTLHGRTTFEDHNEENKKRLLLRTWVLEED